MSVQSIIVNILCMVVAVVLIPWTVEVCDIKMGSKKI